MPGEESEYHYGLLALPIGSVEADLSMKIAKSF